MRNQLSRILHRRRGNLWVTLMVALELAAVFATFIVIYIIFQIWE